MTGRNATPLSTRAPAPARGNDQVPGVVRLILPDETQEQRIARLHIEVRLPAGIRAIFCAARKRGVFGKIEIRGPVSRDGGAALLLPGPLDEAVSDAIRAAIQADPHARDHLGWTTY